MDQNIIDKTYRKLNLFASQSGFSFCEIDTLNSRILWFKEIIFDSQNNTISVENLYAKALTENPILHAKYDEVVVVHDNNLSCFVPNALFDENFLGSYLQYNAKVFETDFFAFDNLDTYEMKSVFIPFVNINNSCIDQFGSFDYKHSSSILVAKLLDFSKNNDTKKMFVHLQSNHFEIVVVQNQKLILYNSFEYKTPEDLIYYILFTAEQLFLNPENFPLEFLGNITEESEFYKIAYKYIRNVSLFDVSDLQTKNTFSEAENRSNYILFNS
jgi:Protein of unknown function (DUF3822)